MLRFAARFVRARCEPGVMEIRRAVEADLAGIEAVSRSTGQPETDSGADPRYVRFLLGGARVLVAVRAGRICGWGAVRAGSPGEILTDLFVAAGEQGAGIGRELLAGLWPDADARGRLTFSSRHPHALPLYVRAGLQPCWPLLYLVGSPSELPATTARARAVDIAQVVAAERDLAGTDRAPEYRYWIDGLRAQPFVVEAGDRVVAAGARLPERLVHLACAGPDTAAAAVFAALRAVDGEQATVCLPGPHPAVRPLLDSRWRIDDYDLAMTTADLTLPTTWAYSPALA